MRNIIFSLLHEYKYVIWILFFGVMTIKLFLLNFIGFLPFLCFKYKLYCHCLMVSFSEQPFLVLMKSNSSCSSFMDSVFKECPCLFYNYEYILLCYCQKVLFCFCITCFCLHFHIEFLLRHVSNSSRFLLYFPWGYPIGPIPLTVYTLFSHLIPVTYLFQIKWLNICESVSTLCSVPLIYFCNVAPKIHFFDYYCFIIYLYSDV